MRKTLAAVLTAGFLAVAGFTGTATAATPTSLSSSDVWKCPMVPNPFTVTYTAAGKPYVVKTLVSKGCYIVG